MVDKTAASQVLVFLETTPLSKTEYYSVVNTPYVKPTFGWIDATFGWIEMSNRALRAEEAKKSIGFFVHTSDDTNKMPSAGA
jgi:hypothetical protein